jgi:hypothetical protein
MHALSALKEVNTTLKLVGHKAFEKYTFYEMEDWKFCIQGSSDVEKKEKEEQPTNTCRRSKLRTLTD